MYESEVTVSLKSYIRNGMILPVNEATSKDGISYTQIYHITYRNKSRFELILFTDARIEQFYNESKHLEDDMHVIEVSATYPILPDATYL